MRIVPVSLAVANEMVEQLHRHHRPVVGHRFSIGVEHDGTLRGVAIVGRPVARGLDDGRTLEVTRTATDGTPNANSCLYGSAWRATKALGYSETGVLITLRGQNAPKLPADPFDTFAANGQHHGLLVPSGGTWNETAQPTSLPMRARTTRENEGLAITAQDIDDCTFRMLEPSEIARGMAFPVGYTILGNRRQQVKQAGNAVTPPAARDLVAAVAEALGVAA